MFKDRNTRYSHCYLIAASFACCIICSPIASFGTKAPRSYVFKFINEYVLIMDKSDNPKELMEDIAAFYSSLPEDFKSDIENTIGSPILSEAQKRTKIRRLLWNCRYGVITTKQGATYKGIIIAREWNGYRRAPIPYIEVQLSKGGNSKVAMTDVVEIAAAGEGQLVEVRTNAGKMLEGNLLTDEFCVYSHSIRSIIVDSQALRALLLGSIKQIQCPQCLRIMEIDWKFCPYDGAPLYQLPNDSAN